MKPKAHQAYPLHWPAGWPRTGQYQRQTAKFMNVTVANAIAYIDSEVRRLGGKNLILSSNYTLGTSNPDDPGVCAYFEYEGAQTAIPCDRWKRIEHNVHAIAKTIEAMRGIERWGAKNMVKAAFRGFAALPAPGQTTSPWRSVLELKPNETDKSLVESAYRRLRSVTHPDRTGGSAEHFHAVQTAYDQAKAELGM